MSEGPTTADWTPAERAAFEARRRSRNRALAILLFALVALFFGITVVRMTGQAAQVPGTARPMGPQTSP